MTRNHRPGPVWGEDRWLDPAEIAAGHYLTWSQTVRQVETALRCDEVMATEWIAVQMASWRLMVWWEPWREPNAALPQQDVRIDLPTRDAAYWRTVVADPSNPDLLKEPMWDHLLMTDRTIVARRDDECRYRKPLFLRSSLQSAIASTMEQLRRRDPASLDDILDAVRTVHENATRAGTMAPNVREVVPLVLMRLESKRLTTTWRKIQAVAEKDEFKARRLKPGHRRRQISQASQNAKLEKSGGRT
jgi:hypothetical protein